MGKSMDHIYAMTPVTAAIIEEAAFLLVLYCPWFYANHQIFRHTGINR